MVKDKSEMVDEEGRTEMTEDESKSAEEPPSCKVDLTERQPLVSVVITTHGTASDLPVMLGSLSHQREYHPGQHSRTGEEFLYAAGKRSKIPYEAIVVSDGLLEGEQSGWGPGVIHVVCPAEGGVGHHTRNYGIQAARGEFIVLTNSDNYFMSGWIHALSQAVQSSTGIVHWNCISNLWRWSMFGGSEVERRKGAGTRLRRGQVDLSCVAVRAEIAKKIGFPWRHYEGDWDYVEACMWEAGQKGMKVVGIDSCLSVHN